MVSEILSRLRAVALWFYSGTCASTAAACLGFFCDSTPAGSVLDYYCGSSLSRLLCSVLLRLTASMPALDWSSIAAPCLDFCVYFSGSVPWLLFYGFHFGSVPWPLP